MIDIKKIKDNFHSIANLNEENIKIKIVIELFKDLGYDFTYFNFEDPVYQRDKRIDFVIKLPQNKVLYIETKRGDRDLTGRDIVQLAVYMHIKSIEWGVLTNGRRLMLLNNKIEPISNANDESSLEDQVVFDIDLFSVRDSKYIKFISPSSLFETCVTNYFRDISQFRAYRFPLGRGSWNVYRSTLFNFFLYYADRELKYRPLEQIRVDDFEDFLMFDQKQKEVQKKSVNSEKTFSNKYSHLRSMFIELKKNKKINSHHFEEERKKLVDNLSTTDVSKSSNELNLENINMIIDYLKASENSTRDITILLLCTYIGLERSTLRSLQWNMFNKIRNKLTITGRTILLPQLLTQYLNQLEDENIRKGIKGNYLFYTKYRKKLNVFNDNSVNEVFDKLYKIDINDSKWRNFSPQYIRTNLIKLLFHNGFSLEEISYLTGADLISLSKIITNEDIINKVNELGKVHIEKHLFGVNLK